jgi:flagellar biosynthesis protein FlhF
MQLRTFLAKDMKAALAAMRAQMGDEAIIVARETLKDGTVLLRAGIEADNLPPQPIEESSEPESSPRIQVDSRVDPFEARFRENLLARLRNEAPRETGPAVPFGREAMVKLLLAHRTPPSLVKVLVEAAEKSGLAEMTLALATALDKFMRTEPFDAAKRGAMLVGPPGAGKTSVAAKLAAHYCLAGSSVALAATDLQTAGQVERLESLAACLNVEVIRISDPAMLDMGLREARDAQTLLIADTGGCDPRASLPPELLSYLSAGTMDLIGIVSASGDAEEVGEIAAALVKIGASRVIVTGLDLSRRKGSLVAIALSGAAIVHVTSSSYLADGLESLTPLALARMLTARQPSQMQGEA